MSARCINESSNGNSTAKLSRPPQGGLVPGTGVMGDQGSQFWVSLIPHEPAPIARMEPGSRDLGRVADVVPVRRRHESVGLVNKSGDTNCLRRDRLHMRPPTTGAQVDRRRSVPTSQLRLPLPNVREPSEGGGPQRLPTWHHGLPHTAHFDAGELVPAARGSVAYQPMCGWMLPSNLADQWRSDRHMPATARHRLRGEFPNRDCRSLRM